MLVHGFNELDARYEQNAAETADIIAAADAAKAQHDAISTAYSELQAAFADLKTAHDAAQTEKAVLTEQVYLSVCIPSPPTTTNTHSLGFQKFNLCHYDAGRVILSTLARNTPREVP